jgi:hypothetical protein
MTDTVTNLRDCYCSGVKPEIAYEYEFYINETLHKTKNQIISGLQIHQLAGTNPNTHFISMKTRTSKTIVGPNINVDLTDCGIERFVVLPFEQQVLDIHDCFCSGATPFITYKYLIKINGDKYEVSQEQITGFEILKLVGKEPANHRVKMFSKSGKKLIGLDEIVDLTTCGIERFVVEPLDCTEGFIGFEKPNQLLPEDLIFLKQFEVVSFLTSGNSDWLILRSCKLPAGFTVEFADVAFLIPKTYPASQLDMFYFFPELKRIDGKPIGALSTQLLEEKSYQRWSRHRSGQNPWDSEVDNIQSHYEMMINCLKEEFKKR